MGGVEVSCEYIVVLSCMCNFKIGLRNFLVVGVIDVLLNRGF